MRRCCSKELSHECQASQKQPFDRCSQTGVDAIGVALASDETDVVRLCRTRRYRRLAGWPAARLLSTLAELELAERDRRRIERHLKEARLVPGKTISSFDFNVVPVVSKSKVMALAAGDVWLNNGHNLLMFGPPGTGKSHLSSAIGLALVENGYRVLFTRTTDLVQRLQRARRELTLENLLARLDRYHFLILDDFAYVSKDQAETSVLFELISVRYERRSILITANQPFDEWHKVFPDQSTAVAAVDRLVHHATILEMNVESYRRRHAVQQARNKPARSSKRATAKKAQPKSVQD